MEEKTLYIATLVFPVTEDRRMVTLGDKQRGIGAGFLNGWGGGVEPGETLKQCACREFYEETGGVVISTNTIQKIGIVHFKNHKTDGTVFVCTVHVYVTTAWLGSICDTVEMKNARWFSVENLATENLMPADPFWLPRMLGGDKGIAWAEYGPHQSHLIGEVIFESVTSFDDEE
ncbi:MAG: NUDIX domain-containing protein [bacterium]